jgi:peptidoglycan/LPS O-acetylase OafA/YrhL
VLVTACVMLAAGWLFRLGYYFGGHPTGSDLEWFRGNPFLRIDACALGVLLACWVQRRGGSAWRPGVRMRGLLFGGFIATGAAGFLMILLMGRLGKEHTSALYALRAIYHIALWPALDLGALGAIVGLIGVWPGRRGTLAAVIRFGSRTSYGLYLIHVPVFYSVTVLLDGVVPAGAATGAVALGTALLLAGLGYRLFEAPILAWRDRRLPVGAAAAARAAGGVPAVLRST